MVLPSAGEDFGVRPADEGLRLPPHRVVDPGVAEREVVIEEDHWRVAERDLEPFLAAGKRQLNVMAAVTSWRTASAWGSSLEFASSVTLTSAQRGVPSLLMYRRSAVYRLDSRRSKRANSARIRRVPREGRCRGPSSPRALRRCSP